jgi:hypothetical protein
MHQIFGLLFLLQPPSEESGSLTRKQIQTPLLLLLPFMSDEHTPFPVPWFPSRSSFLPFLPCMVGHGVTQEASVGEPDLQVACRSPYLLVGGGERLTVDRIGLRGLFVVLQCEADETNVTARLPD